MLNRVFPAAVASALSLSGAASAGIIAFNDASLFALFVSSQGRQVSTEDFTAYSGSAATFSGTFANSGGITWTASASGGMTAGAGWMSTNSAEAMTFTFSQGVQGVGGRFFATDFGFNVQPTFMQVTLSDGSGFIGSISNTTTFTGLYSTGAAITSISIAVDSGEYPTADNLSVAVVPAPGAAALLGAAGLVGRRRRRA